MPPNKHRCAHTRRKDLNMTDVTPISLADEKTDCQAKPLSVWLTWWYKTNSLTDQQYGWQINSDTEISTGVFPLYILLTHSPSTSSLPSAYPGLLSYTLSFHTLQAYTLSFHTLPSLWLVNQNGPIQHTHTATLWLVNQSLTQTHRQTDICCPKPALFGGQ